MTGYKDDEFCHFCGEYLIYLNQHGWLCPNHNTTVLYKYVKEKVSYSLQTRIIKDGLGIITYSNSFEEDFKTIMVEFTSPHSPIDDYYKKYLKNIVGKKNMYKLIWKNHLYTKNDFITISTIPTIINLNPNNLNDSIQKFRKLIVFS